MPNIRLTVRAPLTSITLDSTVAPGGNGVALFSTVSYTIVDMALFLLLLDYRLELSSISSSLFALLPRPHRPPRRAREPARRPAPRTARTAPLLGPGPSRPAGM